MMGQLFNSESGLVAAAPGMSLMDSVLLIPLIYILPHFFADKVFAVFLAEPVADALAVTTTAVMFSLQFRPAMERLEAET